MSKSKVVILVLIAFQAGMLVQYTIDARLVREKFHAKTWGLYHNVTNAALVNQQAVSFLKGASK